jgi:hypothetical protein
MDWQALFLQTFLKLTKVVIEHVWISSCQTSIDKTNVSSKKFSCLGCQGTSENE